MRVLTPHNELEVLLSDDLMMRRFHAFQSWPGETGQLMGIATRTLAWELFVRSKTL